MDNTAAVILLYRRVTGSAPSNAPLIEVHFVLNTAFINQTWELFIMSISSARYGHNELKNMGTKELECYMGTRAWPIILLLW